MIRTSKMNEHETCKDRETSYNTKVNEERTLV